MDLARARRILLCMRYGIGDVVMEMPVLESLRATAPRAHITALVAPPADELLEGEPLLDAIVSIRRWGLTHRWDEGTPDSRAALDRWIAEGAFDTLLDVHHAAVAVGRVVWARAIRSLEADERREEAAVAAGRDAVAAIKDAVRAGWGLAVPDALAPRLHLRDAERDAAASLLSRIGARTAPIALAPVASLPMKRWPPDRYAALADALVRETGRRVLLLAGPNTEAGAAVVAAMRHPDDVLRVGAIHLRRVAALLSRCALLVCNDTGIMHVAAAVGTPVVGLYGPTVPEIFRPPVPHAHAVVARHIRCPHRNTRSLHPPGCWSSPHCLIADRSCVEAVSVEAALAAARHALDGGTASVRRVPAVAPPAPDPSAA
ncbi:MAG TPA: glycosyltransferase family 9 protein [Longimicrobiales bacterium]